MIDYDKINRAALQKAEWILPALLPGGKFRGREYRAADIMGGEGQSFGFNISTGVWKDFAEDTGGNDIIALVAAQNDISQGQAAQKLSEMIGCDYSMSETSSIKHSRRKKKSDESPRPPRAAPTPPETIKHPYHGVPNIIWEYADREGSLIGYVCRFDGSSNGKKKFSPYTYGADGWRWKQWTEPRPLYRLDELTANDELPVILVEGEKAADAAQRLLPGMVATTWPGGSNSVGKADFTPLRDREVYLWPDNDQPGRKAMGAVANKLHEIGSAEVRPVEIPPSKRKTWDLADAEIEGWTRDQTADWIKNHSILLAQDEPAEEELPPASIDDLLELVDVLEPESTQDIKELLSMAQALDPIDLQVLMRSIKQKTGMTMQAMNAFIGKGNSPEKDQFEYAREIIEEIGEKNILATRSGIYLWKHTGVWRRIEERLMKQKIQRKVKEDRSVISSFVNGATEVLINEVYRPDHEFNIGDPEVVNCLNGELHFDASNGIWKILPHNREAFRTSQIPVEYDGNASAPCFRQFLSEIFDGDKDQEDKIKAVLEMFGYSLMAHCRHEKFVILIGAGANGKSVLLVVLEALLGAENVAGVQPSQFSNKFQRAHLHHKLANIVSEIRQGEVIADAELKGIVSGEKTTVEHKNRDPFEMRPYATCWFATNHMPHTRDFSDALFRRALVLKFNRIFSEADKNPLLKDELIKELPGILNLSLDAYAHALLNGFTLPESSRVAKDEWRLEADQARQFVEECCKHDPTGEMASEKVFAAYKAWAFENGVNKALSMKTFRNRLDRLGFGKRRTSVANLITGIAPQEGFFPRT